MNDKIKSIYVMGKEIKEGSCSALRVVIKDKKFHGQVVNYSAASAKNGCDALNNNTITEGEIIDFLNYDCESFEIHESSDEEVRCTLVMQSNNYTVIVFIPESGCGMRPIKKEVQA